VQDFAEFNPTAQPVVTAFGEPLAAAVSVPSPANFDPIACISRSWELLKANFWPFVGMPIVMIVLAQIPNLLFRVWTPKFVPDPAYPFEIFHTSSFWVSLFVPMIITQPLYAGLAYYFLRKARGEAAGFNDLFAGFRRAWIPLIIASWLAVLLMMAGFICLILPGIYLGVAYSFVNLVIIDQRCGIWEALEISRRAITKRWWTFFLFIIISIVIVLAGLCALLVGVFVAIPLIMGAMAYAYLDLVPGSGGTTNQVVQGELARPEGEQNQPGV